MIRINLVGDIMPGDQFCSFGFGVRSLYSDDYDELIPPHIAAHLRNADLLVGNLECSINNTGAFKLETHRLCAEKGALEWLRRTGFDMVSLANNHTLERGVDGFDELCQALESTGLNYFGASHQPLVTKEIDGMKVGFYGFTAIDDYKNTKDIELYDSGRTVSLIKKYSRETDHLIVFPHWGNEFVNFPSESQKEMGRACIDAGASVVVGAHPHVLQPIERYKNGLILYSTGNFIFDSYSSITFPTACFTVELEKEKTPGVSILPLMADRKYRLRNADENEKKVIDHLLYPVGESGDYTKTVLANRSAYRKETLRHLMKNAFRFKDKTGVVKWALNRMKLFLKNRKSEKEDPSNVYKWN